MPLCLGHLVVPAGVMLQQWLGISFHSSFHPNDGDLNGCTLDLIMDGSAKVSSGSMELWPSFPIVALLIQ